MPADAPVMTAMFIVSPPLFKYRCIYHTAFAPVAQACAGKNAAQPPEKIRRLRAFCTTERAQRFPPCFLARKSSSMRSFHAAPSGALQRTADTASLSTS